MLEMNESTEEWAFYPAQPTEGFFEIDQCLVTLIKYSPPDLFMQVDAVEGTAKRLGSFCHYFTFRKVQTVPLINVSLPISDGVTKAEIESNKFKDEFAIPPSPRPVEAAKNEPNFIKK